MRKPDPRFPENILYQGHKHGLSLHEKYKMRKTRLIIILWGFAWSLEGVRRDCFVFEAEFGYTGTLSPSDPLSHWGRQLEMEHWRMHKRDYALSF